MIAAIAEFLQPSVRFFGLLHDDPFRVYLTAALWVAFIEWSFKRALRFLRWFVTKGADYLLGGE